MNDDLEFSIRVSKTADILTKIENVCIGIKQVAYKNRADELKCEDVSLLSLNPPLQGMLRSIIETQKPIHVVHYKKYGFHHHQISELDCDVEDNKYFWNNFLSDLDGENSPERTLLAHGVLTILSDMQFDLMKILNERHYDVEQAEKKRFLDYLVDIYIGEVRFDEWTKKHDVGNDSDLEFGTIRNDYGTYDKLHDYFPFNRDFGEYTAKNIPDILYKVAEFIYPFVQAKENNRTLNLLTPVVDTVSEKGADIVTLADRRPLKPT